MVCFIYIVIMFSLVIVMLRVGHQNVYHSSLQAIFNLKYDHPILVQLLEVYMELTSDWRKTVFIWVPDHVGIRGNSAAVSAAKDAHDGDISDELTSFADVKSRMNKYLLVLWHESGTSSQRINCTSNFHI